MYRKVKGWSGPGAKFIKTHPIKVNENIATNTKFFETLSNRIP